MSDTPPIPPVPTPEPVPHPRLSTVVTGLATAAAAFGRHPMAVFLWGVTLTCLAGALLVGRAMERYEASNLRVEAALGVVAEHEVKLTALDKATALNTQRCDLGCPPAFRHAATAEPSTMGTVAPP